MPDAPTITRATGEPRDHHRPGGGFRNPWTVPSDAVDPLRAARWMAARLLDRPKSASTPRVPLTAADLEAPLSGVHLTWLGHASVLLQSPETAILIDPVFSDRVSPLSFAGPTREVALPIAPEALPSASAVLITHDHYDHLDTASVRRLHARDRPLFVCPLGVAAWLRKTLGVDVRTAELDWWDSVALPSGVRVTATPTKHFSGRGLTDRDGTLWCGYHVAFPDTPQRGGGAVVYNVGDTATAPVFADVARRLAPADVAVVPVGAYQPRWFMSRVHVDPAGALDVFKASGARAMVAAHWGTFDLADEPLGEPPRLVAEEAERRGLAGRVHVLPVGGQRTVAPRGASRAGAPDAKPDR